MECCQEGFIRPKAEGFKDFGENERRKALSQGCALPFKLHVHICIGEFGAEIQTRVLKVTG